MNIKVDFDNIIVKEDKNDFNVKVLMLKGEKGEAGATSWGAITGTLSNQTDLKNALNGKANQTDFNTVSGQVNTNTSNISTINGQITDINGELDDFEDLFYGNATVNDEDTSITLDNTVEAGFESFDLKGNTTQDGTPTPSSPIPVNVVSGDNEISVIGKNLFSGEPYQANAVIQTNGTINSNGNNDVFKTIVEPNQTYTISITSTETTINRDLRIISYTMGGTYIEATVSYKQIKPNITTRQTFTTPANAGYILYCVLHNSKDVMLEKGSTASEYEPYQGNTYNIDLPVENLFDLSNPQTLSSAGITATYDTTKNEITLNGTSSGIGYIAFNINTIASGSIISFGGKVDTPNSNVSIQPANGGNSVGSACTLSSNISKLENETLSNSINRIYIIVKNGTTLNNYVIKPSIMLGSTLKGFTPYGTTPIELCKIGNYQDYFYKDSGKWYLHKEIGKITTYNGETITTEYISTTGQLTTGATIYYGLSTSTNTEVEYQPLIDQLNELEQATSKNGETNISQVNDGLPFIIYAEAFANTFNGRMEGMNYKMENCEVLENKVTSITSGSTDSEYPSAKAVYDLFNSITDGDEVSY